MSANQLLLSYALRYPGLIFLTIIIGFACALSNGISTTLIVPLVLGFLGQENIDLKSSPAILQKIFSFFQGSNEGSNLGVMVVVVIGLILLKNIAVYLNSRVSSHLSIKLIEDFIKEGINLLLEVDLDYFSKTKIGDIVNKIGYEAGRAAVAIRIVINIFTTSAMILTFVGILISISWQLTLASTGLLILVSGLNQFLIKRAKKFGQILSEKASQYSTALMEMLTGIRLIKSVSTEKAEYQRIVKLIEERGQADEQSQANYDAIGPINEVMGTLAILAIIFLGKVFFWQQFEALSTVLLIYLYVLFRLLPIVSLLNAQRSGLANSAPSTEIVAEFLRRDNKPFMANGKKLYTPIEQGLRMEGVTFAYPNHDTFVLKGVDLWVPKGTTLALVGASGAGKSTLADLVARFYDPTEGRITIDGNDLREFDIASLRQSMGIVSQDTYLFNASIRYNIAYGLEDVTEEQVIEAAKRANAYEFIAHLPKGFDTEIGDRGVLLSGGQRQRIAIARALLRDPDILILDEATSALDTVSERLVQQAIEELCRDRTTIVIAHRLSTVQKADQIAVLDQGRVMESGNHQELLEKGGYYSRLYEMQFERGATPDSKDIDNAVNKALIQASYEVRSHLNPVMGFLGLVVDDLVDNTRERRELTEEAYNSAIRLLRNLELLEEHSKAAQEL